jgi:uncharacterized protein YbjT (DUF2867 family)
LPLFRSFKTLFGADGDKTLLKAKRVRNLLLGFSLEPLFTTVFQVLLRRFPIFGVFGRGEYRLIPIDVDDLARLAVEQAFEEENIILDAIGPEVFSYQELVQTIGRIIGKRRPIISVPPFTGWLAAWIIRKMVGGVLLTKEEIYALKHDLLYVGSPPAGRTKLTDWAELNSHFLGRFYQSELARRLHNHSPE